MACNCKGGKAPSTPLNGVVQSSTAQESTARLSMNADSDYEMVKYTHPNRGQHPVIGAATGNSYGFRSGGGSETFLVHRSDIGASPNFFTIASKVPSPPVVEVKPLAPPVSIVEPVEEDEKGIDPVASARKLAMNQVKFDLQGLPGVTPAIAKSMISAGLLTPEKIIETGALGLEQVKFVGEKRAKAIFDYVNENYGQVAEAE